MEESTKVVVFLLADQPYAVPVGQVREIIRWPGVRPVPQTHQAFLGVSSVRGEVLPVLDLAAFLGIRSAVALEQKKLILLEVPDEELKLGLAVDHVHRIYTVENDQIDTSLVGTFLGENLVSVIKRDGENILVPDFRRILSSLREEALRMSQAMGPSVSGEPSALR
jgi:two-component system chemotaxis response regulator CheV